MKMDISALKKLVGDGKIFSCRFVKRSDGTIRRMVARTGVKLGLTGRGPAYDPEAKGLLTVYDMEKHGYRTIPAENVIEVHCHGDLHVIRSSN